VQIERLRADDVQRMGGPVGVASYLRSLVPASDSVSEVVRAILAEVRQRGEAAVLDYTRRFDTSGSDPKPLLVTPEELDLAIRQLDLDVIAGLQVAIANVAEVAQAGVGQDVAVDLPQGQRVTLREIPVSSAAVYVPGGRAPYPSTVVMGVVTARAAGVMDVVVCSPPGTEGEIDPAILGTCRLLGVERVYRMGGAQAIAALAYGTETISRVDVIVGPGNLYVQEAKLQLSNVVGIDAFAGPSDLLVAFGNDADTKLVAFDLMAQAEHGTGSLVAAISPSAEALDALAENLDKLAEQYPDLRPAACVLAEMTGSREAIELANAFAPEHLELIGSEIEQLAPAVQSAGCVFVGSASATAFGDYVAGSNHVLPTAGAARFSSSLSARHFRRRMPEVRIGAGAAKLSAAGGPIARTEGFVLHAESMTARIGENQGP
jgi:histidinol dehydrogenase